MRMGSGSSRPGCAAKRDTMVGPDAVGMCVVRIYKHQVIFRLPILLLIQASCAQQQIPADPSPLVSLSRAFLVSSGRPLVDASLRLQEAYGKVVTYEEPILTWRGELEGEPGRDPEGKWALFP